MFDSTVYNEGTLIVGKMSGVIEPQSFINGIFWQIDSRNIGQFRTALILRHSAIVRLAKRHQSLAKKHGLEVELFDSLEDGFNWLACTNPDPENIKL